MIELLATPISGLMIAKITPFKDQRGSFRRLFCTNELNEILQQRHIVQINHSLTHTAGAIRGMHFQHPPYAEMKLVQCLKGKVWDVAVDLRSGSSTRLHWHAVELSPENGLVFIIPEGFAHGFQVIEPDSELLYFHTVSYTPSHEGGVRWDDPILNITWPMEAVDLSQRDRQLPPIEAGFQGISI